MIHAARILTTIPPHLRLIAMSQDEKLEPTMAPPTERQDEVETNPRASEAPAQRPAVNPPPPDDLASSQLARREPPEWWSSSFIGSELSAFAKDAEDLRKGRAIQHSQQLEAIAALGRQQETHHRNLGSSLARIGERMTRIETEQRNQGRDIKTLQTHTDQEKVERQSEMRALKSIVTALAIRMDMYESNGHAPKDLAGVQVLVVEDEILLQRTIQKLLVKQGARVSLASSWEEVTTAVESVRPDFVVLDIRLEREDGVQVAEWLMAHAKLKPRQILLMTGQLDPESNELSGSMGLRIFEKPFGADDLTNAIKESLAAAAAETPPG